MEKSVKRRLDMFRRVSEFAVRHAAEFTDTANIRDLFARLDGVIEKLETSSADRAVERGNRKSGTEAKARGRAALLNALQVMSRTARVLTLDHPELKGKFNIPKGLNDRALLETAHTFLVQAEPFRALFVNSELPADFLETLEATVTGFTQADKQQSVSFTSRRLATAGINGGAGDGQEIVMRLDMLIRNRYGKDRDMMTSWQIATRQERHMRSASTQKDGGSGGENPESE
ncbi:MAG: hypothetical protein ACKV2V_06320 [Blastocatellia bacterium]